MDRRNIRRPKKQSLALAMAIIAAFTSAGKLKAHAAHPAKTVSVRTSSLPQGTVGAGYSTALQANGGKTPYAWSVASGQLPAGLSLSSSGKIFGTPSGVGSASFTVMVQDSSMVKESATASLSITVVAAAVPPVSITTSSLPQGTVGAAYAAALQASGGTSPYSWQLSGGSIPAGLALAASGQISGTPTAAGQFSLTVKVVDSSSSPQSASASFTVTVVSAAPPLSIQASTLAAASMGVAYSASLQASGGTAPYTWSVTSGQLPAGLNLASAGQISGTPSASGSFSFTINASDSSSPAQSTTGSFSISVAAAGLSLIPASVNFGNVPMGVNATQSIQITNTGNAALMISQVSIAASGFTVSGLTVPLNLAAGQTANFVIQFSPTAAGSATGSVAILSNAPNSPASLPVSGTSHWVTVGWTASTSTVVGYNIYRGTQSGGAYTLVNSAPVNATTFDDTTVTPGQTYYYVVTAVDANNVESVYSNEVSAAVPTP